MTRTSDQQILSVLGKLNPLHPLRDACHSHELTCLPFSSSSIIRQKLSTIRKREGTMEETNAGGDKMTTEDALEFEIEVLDSNATEEDLDRITRNLLSELRDTNVESANLVSVGTAPEGSKGDPIAIGTLAMSALPIVLPGVIDMIKDWANRGKGRTVKFKGKGIEFEGSPEELEKVLATLEKGRKKK